MRALAVVCARAALLSALILAAGCGNAARNENSRAVDEKAIRELVDRTVAAAGKSDMAEYSKFYAPNAALVLPGMAISNMTAPLKNGFAAGYAIKMVTVKAEVSDSGDLGYAFGTYEQTAPDKSGALIHSVGKWMSVFRKQLNGAWGAIADTYNVDPPT
jgi:ketosteroid isomerase-like protein